MIRKMMEPVREWHAGQFRNATVGEIPPPYIVHPVAVAKNLLDWGETENSEAVAIAWGHDLLKDTKVTGAEILAASNEHPGAMDLRSARAADRLPDRR